MAKRFLDTGLWSKPWFRELGAPEKAAWLYLLTNCDAVGVWDADKKLAEFCIGSEVNWEGLRAAANGNIEVLENGKWFLVDFCTYQYGELNEDCRPHKFYISLLEKHGLKGYLEKPKGYRKNGKGYRQNADTPKEKEKDIEKEKEPEKESYAESVTLRPTEYEKLASQYGEANTKRAIAKLSAYKLEKGKTYKSDYGAILNWVMREVMGQKGAAVPEPVKKSVGPPCPECGKECKREFGYWHCPVHGRREELA